MEQLIVINIILGLDDFSFILILICKFMPYYIIFDVKWFYAHIFNDIEPPSVQSDIVKSWGDDDSLGLSNKLALRLENKLEVLLSK